MSVWSLTFFSFLMFFSFLSFAHAIPVVISRYGGRSSARQVQYAREETRRVNTCSLARIIHPDIQIGQCPNVVPKYHTEDSASLLRDYYKNRCDKVYTSAPPPFIVGAFFGIVSCLATVGLFFCFVVIVINLLIKFLMGFTRLVTM
jgi:hypothetical protein